MPSHTMKERALQKAAVGESPGCENIPYEALRVLICLSGTAHS